MQAKAGKALRAQFHSEMQVRLPTFTPVADSEVPPGDRLYKWAIDDRFIAYLLLAISPKSDAFTLEAGWTADGHFPFDILCMAPIDLPQYDIVKDAPLNGKFRFRLPELWAGKDVWWHLSGRPGTSDMSLKEFLADGWMNPPPQYSKEQIANAVEEAIAKIEVYALPYFRQAAGEKALRNSE